MYASAFKKSLVSTKGESMSSSGLLNNKVKQHYTRPELWTLILTALADAGKDLNRLGLEDLAPIDEFRICGREATLELAAAVGIDSNNEVLDVDSGIGGPSRCIAHEFGCQVTGIDLTEEYCRVATMLAERVGLSDHVTYHQCDALSMPFPDEIFDVVWTQHAAMKIKDKETLYSEMYRVLKHGGSLAVYDILAGPSGPVLFPVPWARTPETSFLVKPDELRQLLQESGFTITDWKDTTAAAESWFTGIVKKVDETGTPPLGFQVLMGEDFPLMARNQMTNLQDKLIVLAQVAARKNLLLSLPVGI